MAILGLKLKFSAMEFDIAFLGFLVVWLISHVVIMLIAAKLLNVSIAWVPIASIISLILRLCLSTHLIHVLSYFTLLSDMRIAECGCYAIPALYLHFSVRAGRPRT